MHRAALGLLLLVPVLRADDKKPDPKADLAALKGKWKVTAAQFDGKESALAGRVLAFDEKEFTAYDGDKKGRTVGFTLDPAADPKRIDLALPGTDRQAAGVYALDGDKLTLCYGEPGAVRPKTAASKEGEKTFLLVLERVKP